MSTRCSETYETKTALISLFGVPLWYFSQSPRVAIQVSRRPGRRVRVPALSRRGAAVTVWGCVPSASTELQAGACKSQVCGPGCASRSSSGPRSRVPHLTGPVVPARSEAISDASAGLACFWTWRRRGCPRHPVLGLTVSRVSPTAQTQGCLRGHSLACPWGAWPLAGWKDPAGDPEPQAQGGRLVRLERRRRTRGAGVDRRWSWPPDGRPRVRAAGPPPQHKPSRGERSASVIWGCVHTQGVNVGSPFSRRVAASRCSGLSTWGVHPQHRAGFVWWGLWSVCNVRGGERCQLNCAFLVALGMESLPAPKALAALRAALSHRLA